MDLSNHNKLFKEIKNEIVVEKDVAKAYIILYNIQMNNWADVYLFCSCINLLNTYVKQDGAKIGYSFKSRVHFLVSILASKFIEGIKIDNKVSPKDSLFIVDIYGVQFSFHNVKINADIWRSLKEYQTQISWDGIRKQQCATTVFNYAYALEERSNLTKYEENLDDFMQKVLKEYDEGKYIIEKRGLISINGTFC